MSSLRSSSRTRLSQISSSPLHVQTPQATTLAPLASKTQTRNATYIPRKKRPYTFTQLMTLSDGSTFLHRTTSPAPVYRSTRDTRNTPLWNPSNARMANVEEDEAGRLRAFRRKFGRAFDAREGEPAPAKVEDLNAPSSAPTATREEDGVVKEVIRSDARAGGKSEGRGQASSGVEAEAEARDEQTSDRPPPSAAVKTQKEAEEGGQGMGTSAGWGEDFGEDENLMDLISSAGMATGRVKEEKAKAPAKGKGKKR